MLSGIKVKPKRSENFQGTAEENPSISTMIREEKKVKPHDYNKNLLENTKNSQNSDYDEEPENYTTKILNFPKQPVTLKTLTCGHCIDSKEFPQDLLISIEESVHVSLPSQGPLLPGHLIISPNNHVLASTELESDEFEDLQEAKRKVLKFYIEEYGKKGVFVEHVNQISACEHMFIECFPVTADALEDSYGTVMQELNEADDEWTDNKKVIKVDYKGIQEKIPQGFPYIYFDFNMQRGLAHVIENSKKFKPDFSIKMLAETLGLDLLFTRRKTNKLSLHIVQTETIRKWSSL